MIKSDVYIKEMYIILPTVKCAVVIAYHQSVAATSNYYYSHNGTTIL